MTSLETDLASARADLARPVDDVRALEFAVKKADDNVVAKVTGMKATVATVRAG